MIDRRNILKAGVLGLFGGSLAEASNSRTYNVKLPEGMTAEQFMEELKYRFKNRGINNLVIARFDDGTIVNKDEFMGPWEYLPSPDDYLVPVGPPDQNRVVKYAKRSGTCYVHMKDALCMLNLSTNCEIVKCWGEMTFHQSVIGREFPGLHRDLELLIKEGRVISDDLWAARDVRIAPTAVTLTPRTQQFNIERV